MDFYQTVNDEWLGQTTIPDDYQRWGTFEELNDNTQKRVKGLLETQKDTLYGKFYQSGMNMTTRDSEGLKPLSHLIKDIFSINDSVSISTLVSRFNVYGISMPLSRYISGDARQSTHNVAHLCQGGVGLPDRDYYFDDDKTTQQSSYRTCIQEMFQYLSTEYSMIDPSQVDYVYQFEKDLAKHHLTRTARRDPVKTYNSFTLEELQTQFSYFDWTKILEGTPSKIIVEHPDYLANLATLLKNTDRTILKHYFLARMIMSLCGYLDTKVFMIAFRYTQSLTGQKAPKPLWKRTLMTVETLLGEPLSRDYVAQYFPDTSKQKMLTLVDHIIDSFGERLKKVDWMGADTKEKALEKLSKIRVKIGYPDKWRDYTTLSLSSSYFQMYLTCHEFEFRYEWDQIDLPVDKSKWEMNAHEINAYYHPTRHEIVFPAGILQSPFFSPDAKDSENYGGIGAVIGHEITHGFDDQGRQYDKDGNLSDWWTEEDSQEFKRLTSILEKQYSQYMVEDKNVNGSLTLGENIADLGGLTIAYYAWKASQESAENKENDATPLFYSWARVWRNQIRTEEAKRLVVIDPHSPGKYRVNGVVSNMPEYYQTFQLDIPTTCLRIW